MYDVVQVWSVDTIKQYLLWVKSTFHPDMTQEAEEVLTGYYKMQRSACDGSSARSTVRLLESLLRIAQAHAKLMARDAVTQQDAVIAVSLVETASKTLGSGVQFTVGAEFCEDPDTAYDEQSQYLLEAVRQLHSESD